MIWQFLAVTTDLLHAMLMVAWVIGMPLLLWHRWPRLAQGYAGYAIAFVTTSQLSQWLLGECFLTNIALWFWERVPSSAPVSHDWFTVRIARAVFHMAPSHRFIAHLSEALVLATALAALWSLHRLHERNRGEAESHREGRDLRERPSSVA